MNTTDQLIFVLLLSIVGAAIAVAGLFFLIRGAILSALEEDRRRVAQTAARAARPTSHMDADGL